MPVTADKSVESHAADGERASAGLAGEAAGMLSAAVLALVLTALSIWWPLEQGAYFPVVYLPGAILLYVTLITLLIVAPLPIAFRGPHAVALAALLTLTGWTALSLLWSPAQDLALEDAQRTMIYPAAFLAGLWLSALLSKRVALSMLPWAVAATIVAVVTVVRILGIDGARDVLDGEGTLEYPFAYRNANAAFFIISALVLVAAMARRRTAVPLQAGWAAAAVCCLGLAVLSESRGSILAAAAGIVALLLFSPSRGRVVISLLVVSIPLLVILPELLDPFGAVNNQRPALGELHQAARALAVAALAGAALAVPIGLLLRRRRRPSARRERGPGRTQLVVLGAAALLSAAVVGVVADPVSWISTNESSEGANSRFNYTGGLNRTDFWAVSANQFSDAPLIGGGSGSFRTRYAVERESPELPRDAHSLGFETLGELGAIGVVLLVIVGGALAAAVFKSRRLGPDEATLAAAALAVGAAWAAQASVDWLTSFPGLTAPVLVLLGAAAGPAALRSGRDAGRRTRVVLGTVLAAAAVAALPLFASDRLTFNAAERWTADPEAAFDALDRAADLNPFADAPFLVAAEIAKQTGDTERGLDALASARDRQQDEWLSYLIEAEILADTDPEAALEALMRARELNPLDEDIAELEKELRAPRRSG